MRIHKSISTFILWRTFCQCDAINRTVVPRSPSQISYKISRFFAKRLNSFLHFLSISECFSATTMGSSQGSSDIHGPYLRTEDAAHGAYVVLRGASLRKANSFHSYCIHFTNLQPLPFPRLLCIWCDNTFDGALFKSSTLLDRNRLRGCNSKRHSYVDDARSACDVTLIGPVASR